MGRMSRRKVSSLVTVNSACTRTSDMTMMTRRRRKMLMMRRMSCVHKLCLMSVRITDNKHFVGIKYSVFKTKLFVNQPVMFYLILT